MSISFPGVFFPGTMLDKSIPVDFIHSHGGVLYGIRMIGQVLWLLLILPNGLKPSVASPSLRLRGSAAKSGNFKSKVFHASPSRGCLAI
ncbi:hypothetical protein LINGRAHAP2_LOCUS5254, partial [Linum grandiflorum]